MQQKIKDIRENELNKLGFFDDIPPAALKKRVKESEKFSATLNTMRSPRSCRLGAFL
jgi:hypothetical protein